MTGALGAIGRKGLNCAVWIYTVPCLRTTKTFVCMKDHSAATAPCEVWQTTDDTVQIFPIFYRRHTREDRDTKQISIGINLSGGGGGGD
jgi:hypothetical protein